MEGVPDVGVADAGIVIKLLVQYDVRLPMLMHLSHLLIYSIVEIKKQWSLFLFRRG
jgi:hypothetical protein